MTAGRPAPGRRPFLTARWESLLLLNYRCPPALLEPLVPHGTELDSWEGSTLVSLVGFRFVDTRVLGIGLPGHRSFEEVNLRFYVRREVANGVRRGVVFIRELVPRRLIATVARIVYNEPYLAVPMGHDVDLRERDGGSVRYSWVHGSDRHSALATVTGPAQPLTPDSEAAFITEHYWGYNRQCSGVTMEYRVDHPAWAVWEPSDARYECPPDPKLYGDAFASVLAAEPVSAFVAVGSPVTVFRGSRLGPA